MSNEIDDYDYRRFAILFVDDDPNTRNYFHRLFSDKFRVLEAKDGVQALKVFRQHAREIGIIMIDQLAPGGNEVSFLSKASDDYPDIIKILSTPYSDIEAAIGSVNQGGIFRYMTKPWDISQLEVTLRRAMEFFTVKRERDALLGARAETTARILLASRLSAFALAPVCAGIPCKRAAEAIAAFVRTGIAGCRNGSTGMIHPRAPDWTQLHVRQLAAVTDLESQLRLAMKTDGLQARMETLARQLTTAGFPEVTYSQVDGTTRITSTLDRTSDLLDALLGFSDDTHLTESAVEIIAAYMAVFDAGAVIRRTSGVGMTLELSESKAIEESSNPGCETAKWLFDDDLLISSAMAFR